MADEWDAIENDTSGQPLRLAQDSVGIWVYCSREVWRGHILIRHAEIEAFKDLIIAAIQSSEQEPDPEDSRTIRYYTRVPNERLPAAQALWLRVVVKYVYPPERNNQRTGLLSSVYLIRRKE